MALLELHDVSYQAGQNTILDHLSFTLEEGAFLTITGPSGSGKSTLLRVIASLVSPTNGELLFNGKQQRSYDYTDYRQQVSYCFQQPALFGDTVEDNLAFPYFVRSLSPDLPSNYVSKKITELSGGERQRVAMIRNILFLPKILLLDEVTTGLDESTKGIIHRLVQQLQQQGCSIMQVTHDESEIQAAKELLILQEGRLKK
jgi:putative ABC transport system ATP-binding protein